MKEQCRGKRAYRSRGLAERSIRAIKRRSSKELGRPVATYLCPTCQKWHLTSSPR